MIEQTLSIIKPDAVERNLEDKIKSFFIKKNLKIIKSKKVQISKEEASEFYKIHQTKPFYNDLCNYLSSGPIIVMILEGEEAISKNRQIMGATDPSKAEEVTLEYLTKFWSDYKTRLENEIATFETAIKNWKLQPTPRERLKENQ